MGRWSEEVKLLEEEMRRIQVTMEVTATRWDGRTEAEDASLSPDIKEGIRAYAKQQAAVQRDLAGSFSRQWQAGGVDTDDLDNDWEDIDNLAEGADDEEEGDDIGR